MVPSLLFLGSDNLLSYIIVSVYYILRYSTIQLGDRVRGLNQIEPD